MVLIHTGLSRPLLTKRSGSAALRVFHRHYAEALAGGACITHKVWT